MKEESDASKKVVKTYISESNQNKITHTLEVEVPVEQSAKAQPEERDQAGIAPAGETDRQVRDSPAAEEPELLNAPTQVWPPTSAAADAAAVAGLPLENIPGQEGDFIAPSSGEETRHE